MSPRGNGCSANEIDAGKMLFSASDDGTIKLWDLTLRTCVRTMTGHMGQVQSMKLLTAGDCSDDELPACEEGEDLEGGVDESAAVVAQQGSECSASNVPCGNAILAAPSAFALSSVVSSRVSKPRTSPPPSASFPNSKKPVLISGSFFGHIEGVWAVASDKLRLVSGSHDRTIKVWSRDEGKCTSTLVGHKAAVSCLALGEDKIVSGSDDSDVRVWSFSG